MEKWSQEQTAAFSEYRVRTERALQSIESWTVAEAAWHMRPENRLGANVYIIGNGGSLSTASHIAADLSRGGAIMGVYGPPDFGWMSGQANDFGYETVFEAMLRMFAMTGDLLIAISVSKQSPNILRACEYWRNRGDVIGLWGRRLPAGADKFADVSIFVEEDDPRIVETCHLAIGQAWATMVRS